MIRMRTLGSLLALSTISLLLARPAAQAQQQSPVDFLRGNTAQAILNPLTFSYSTNTSLHVINTGSPDTEATIRAVVPATKGSVSLSGTSYELKQFHFHAEAEHLRDGFVFPMEMHMVHADAGGNLLVVGRWIEESAADNPVFADMFSHLPATSANTYDIASFNLNDLIPGDLSSFRYPGSLTTAPYTEGVSWVVLDAPLSLSHAQITAFEALFPDGDAREVQALNGRVVRTDVIGFATPEPGAYGLFIGLATVGAGMLRRRRQRTSAKRIMAGS